MGSFIGNVFIRWDNPRAVAHAMLRIQRTVIDESVLRIHESWSTHGTSVDNGIARGNAARQAEGAAGPFFLSDCQNGWVGVYDPSGPGDEEGVLAQKLSQTLSTEAISFLVFDSGYLRYSLYSRGKMLDRYKSDAADDEGDADLRGEPGVLADVFDCPGRKDEIEAVLHTSKGLGDDRLKSLAGILGLSNTHASYDYLADGEMDSVDGWDFFLRYDGQRLRQVTQKRRPRTEEPLAPKTVAFHEAARSGNMAEVRRLLAEGIKVDAADKGGTTALMLAVQAGHLEMVRVLLAAKANVGKKTKAELFYDARWRIRMLGAGRENGITAMHIACLLGHMEMVKVLLAHGADPLSRTKGNDSSLLLAGRNQHTDIVRLFLDSGLRDEADLDSIMLSALYNGPAGLVQLLVEHGLSPDTRSLVRAARGDQLAVVSYLLSIGVGDDTAFSALASAADQRRYSVFCRLLQHHGAQAAKDPEVFRQACIGGDDRIVKLLLEQGARPQNWKNTYELLAHVDSAEIMKTLLEIGVRPDDRNAYGQTPLMWAAVMGRREIAKLLIDYGADVNAQSNGGYTPLHYCRWDNASPSVARQLLRCGADPYITDDDGRDFKEWIKEYPHKEMLRIVEEIEAQRVPSVR